MSLQKTDENWNKAQGNTILSLKERHLLLLASCSLLSPAEQTDLCAQRVAAA